MRTPLTPGPGSDVRRDWKRINEIDSDVALLLASRLTSRISDDPLAGADSTPRMFPFRIYQYPVLWRPTPGADDWRKFRVRAGQVLEGHVHGTDAAVNPDSTLYPDSGVDLVEVMVPAITELAPDPFWFWIEVGIDGLGTTHSYVRWGTDPTVSSYSSTEDPASDWTSTDPWVNHPIPDERHIPIGYIDYLTSGEKPGIRQLLRTDVVTVGGGVGGMHYEGVYDSSKSYTAEAVVITRNGSGSTFTWGLWVALLDVPATNAPVWPEPTSPATVYWQMLAQSGQVYNLTVCLDGVDSTIAVYGPPS